MDGEGEVDESGRGEEVRVTGGDGSDGDSSNDDDDDDDDNDNDSGSVGVGVGIVVGSDGECGGRGAIEGFITSALQTGHVLERVVNHGSCKKGRFKQKMKV